MSNDLTNKMEVGTVSSSQGGDADEAELARMGYKQELKRDFGPLELFGLAFSLIGEWSQDTTSTKLSYTAS